MVAKGATYTKWTTEEANRAATLWQKHFMERYGDDERSLAARNYALTIIARAIGRPFENVYNRHTYFGPTFASAKHRDSVAHHDALKEMERRREAAHRRTLTSSVFGDPPPGYSALDKRVGP